MKKTPLLITFGIILLIAAGYYAYDRFVDKVPIKPWDLVPEDAMMVYEKNSCNACLDELGNATLMTIIERAAFYKKPVDSLKKKLSGVLKNNPGFLLSAHVTKKDDFDLIYYLPYSNDLGQILFESKYRHTSREFNAIQIHELNFSSQLFSFAVIENVWVGSFTPFLVEDVVRTYKKRSAAGSKRNALETRAFSSIQDDAGNLYVKLANFPDLLTLFSSERGVLNFPVGSSALLDIKVKGNTVVLNGFSYESAGQPANMLSVFRHQSPVSFGLKHLVSNRAIAVSSYGISDGELFYNDLQGFVNRKNPVIKDSLAKLSDGYNFGLENLYKSIGDEFSVCFLESSRGRKISKILLVESSEPEAWVKTFSAVAQKLSLDTIFYEKYSHYEIREVPVFRFSEKLLWPFVKGFDQNFYTVSGNVILMADNLEELKNFLDDIETEDTWGKSVSQNRFLESTLLESNVSLYFNPAKAWNVMLPDLRPKWKDFVRDNEALLQALQMSSVQFSHLNNSYYTNVLFTYKPFDPSLKETTDIKNRSITNFDRGILNLHAVKSHVNRSNEILIQDSLNDLSLISSEGKPLWKMSLGDKIISDVTQVDFFNNGKLQYFFATPTSIHIIDRLGNYVSPYPLHFPDTDIEYVSVVDYDNSKRYRILVADKKGKLWMYDKEGNALEGWKPNDIGGSLAMPPRHHRIKGKDFILAVRRDGQVFLKNRRGENLKKFPLDSESIPSGDYFLETGSSLTDTYFAMVSRDGFRIRFNVEGKIQSRETLPKTSVMSDFSLIREKSGKSYLILQQDGRQLILTDETGKRIISSNVTGVAPSDIKYYNFGSGNVFITLTDRIQGFSYLYDGQGKLLTAPPIESNSIEVRPASTGQFGLFFIHGKSLVIQLLQV